MGFSNILMLLGGLGFFLFGMNFMGSGLENAAGSKMNELLNKLTKSTFRGFLLGILVTAIIQSSSATTVMVMGFLNAGMMNLTQATGVIIGANIGTTVTSVLIALDVSGIAPACIFIGAILYLFFKKQNWKYAGQVILGFGLLFQGLNTMSSAMSCLKDSPAFTEFILNVKNPVLGVLVGVLLCALMQSSSASVGILQAFAMQDLMPIHFASYLICGINIGSAVPPFLSAINAKPNAKRAAFIYFIYNVVGAVIFIPVTLLTPYTQIFEFLTDDPVVQVSMCHIVFKLVTALVLLPFTKQIVALSYKAIPEKEVVSQFTFRYIDVNLLSNPHVAMDQVSMEVRRMIDLVRENYVEATEGMLTESTEKSAELAEKEQEINFLNKKITEFLIRAGQLEKSYDMQKRTMNYFRLLIELERIGDHAMELVQKTQSAIEQNLVYSDKAKAEIDGIYNLTLELFDRSIVYFYSNGVSREELNLLHDMKDDVETRVVQSQENHIVRLRSGECSIETGILFDETLHAMERVAERAYNIAHMALVHTTEQWQLEKL
ncbi:MAG: Na/Pi cotransporter family protein [Lachnospiraceae bacterium]|nr:Na/Pi cotransporter family protein [Lachnospiraceae bacterium]